MSDYAEKLRDPRWQRKRLEILNRDEWKCTFCDDSEKTLHVHHKDYVGQNPWDTPNNLLITLCKDCHQFETEEIKRTTNLLIKALKNKGFTSHDFIEASIAVEEFSTDEIIRFMHEIVVKKTTIQQESQCLEWIAYKELNEIKGKSKIIKIG